jgi:hypothetical protein
MDKYKEHKQNLSNWYEIVNKCWDGAGEAELEIKLFEKLEK